jgi:signal transduction histidine kinase
MTSILGFSELLLRDDNIPEKSRHEWLERVHQNSQILSAIVDDMLDVSRIQSGILQLKLEPISLGNVVNELLAGIRPNTEVHEFVIRTSQDIPDVVADREKLSQVLMNLLTNAVKYSPDGGEITVSASHEEERERVVVEVADQGMGIAPEDQAQLFASFHRIRRPETDGIRGTGLGLSIVKGLMGLMGGDVWMTSELNRGSSFFFSVPTRRSDLVEGAFSASRH